VYPEDGPLGMQHVAFLQCAVSRPRTNCLQHVASPHLVADDSSVMIAGLQDLTTLMLPARKPLPLETPQSDLPEHIARHLAKYRLPHDTVHTFLLH